MSLGFGGGSSKTSTDASSQSTSSSDAYGYNGATSGDMSRSLQESAGGGQSSTTQGLAFEDIYKQLYGGAQGAAGRVALQAPQLAQAAQQLFTGGGQFLQSLGGNAGTNYQADRLTGGGNSELEGAIGALRSDAESLFSDQVNPQIVSGAVSGGNLGGGRQGVAEGIAKGQIGKDFLSKAAMLRYSDVQSKDAMAGEVARNSIAAANTGLGSLPTLLDTLERGQNAELGAYSSLSSILGGPTVLSQQQSTDFSRSTAQSIADAFSKSFGEQFSTSDSQSTSTSKSRGKSWNFDFNAGVGPS